MANGTALCKGGCGRTIPKNSASGYARGHTAEGCPSSTALATTKKHTTPQTSTALATTGEIEIEYEAPRVALELDEQQLDRIYSMFPIEEKALGVITALTAERS